VKLTRVFCGEPEFLAVQHQFAFLLDMNANYGFLNSYGGGDPKAVMSPDSDPTLLGYYVTEHSNAMRRALYCIVSRHRAFEHLSISLHRLI
jgi:hypothetical protein